ncbi:MAG: hypothetical protein ISR96_08065 [Nitrospira sp.]|nr:hypothetical protein [bacterium]MBL7049452.1 hypothetical protein [Nitrospira sp.]
MKDQNGKVVFTDTKEFAVYDLHFEDQPDGFAGLNEWDITKMSRFNTGLHPLEEKSEVMVIKLPAGTTEANIEANFRIIHEEGKEDVTNSATKKVTF